MRLIFLLPAKLSAYPPGVGGVIAAAASVSMESFGQLKVLANYARYAYDYVCALGFPCFTSCVCSILPPPRYLVIMRCRHACAICKTLHGTLEHTPHTHTIKIFARATRTKPCCDPLRSARWRGGGPQLPAECHSCPIDSAHAYIIAQRHAHARTHERDRDARMMECLRIFVGTRRVLLRAKST